MKIGLIHFELIFGCGVRYKSNFILFHVIVYLIQNFLFQRLVIPCGQSFLTCEKLVCHIYMPVFLDYHLDPIDVYICPYGSTIISIFSFFCSKLWNQKILATQFWYSFKIILIILCQLTFHINFWNNLSVSWGKYPYLRF